MVDMGRKVGDLFGQLGVPAEVLEGRLKEIANKSLARLQNLKTAYGAAALEANKFGKGLADGRANIPPFAWNPLPKNAKTEREAFLRATYFEPPPEQKSPNSNPFPGLLNARTKRRTELAILLNSEPSVRTAFEKIAGGHVVCDGRMDGKISMVDAGSAASSANASGTGVSTGALTGGGYGNLGNFGGYGNAPLSQNQNLYNLLMAMDQAVMDEAQKLRPGASQFWELDVGVGSLLSDDPSASSKFGREEDEESDDPEAGDFPHMSRSGLAGVTDQLNPQTAGGESVDTGTLRLKRILDKRDQMYDIVNKVYEKFNAAANQAIGNLRS